MMKINVKKMVVYLFMFVMVMTMLPCVALAEDPDPALIDETKTGSITVTKYANTNSSAIKGDATGTQSDQPTDPNYKTLQGAEFVLVKIYDANTVMNYYNGKEDALILNTTKLVEDSSGWKYNSSAVDSSNVKKGTTDANGKLIFSNLPFGIYILREITAPAQITVPLAEDSLISIPMVNTQYKSGGGSNNNGNAAWMYDVYVYPKNHESSGTVELIKQDQNNHKLQNVVFELYKKEFQSNGELTTEDWKDVTTTTDNGGASTTLTLKTDADGKITLANLPAGLYGTQYKLVEIYQAGTSPEGYIINSNPLYFKVNKDNTISWNNPSGEKGDCNNTNTGVIGTTTSTTDTKLTITLRNEIPSLTKKVHENEPGAGWKYDEQYRLDDEITYRLIAYVPNNVAELGTYEIKDIPQIGITDSDTSTDYTVTFGNDPDTCNVALDTTEYTREKIPADSSNGQGFKLTLTAYGKNATAGKYIQIVYKAHMNASAVIAGNGNGNTATLTYSKFIGGGTGDYTITDEARVYTYQYQITKRKDTDTGDLIPGVQFELLNASKNNMSVIALKDPGVYRLALAGETGSTTLTTANDGTILIKGLENGTYYLKETKTIDGYNLLSAPFQIDLSVSETPTWNPDTGYTSTGRVVKSYGNSTTYSLADAKGTSTIINKKGFVLPQTGGMGYLLFCTAGILLIGGGAALIFGGRRKKIR
ncbi:SpaH/EbpB family LPXTG-anchored major pilin [Blautia sp. Sow4_E7]|uniref:SpaH/EbpB family LPXTG-anchored major pilin n=1 Tax=Blautia sp. Sow4_E7 TaxID=3438749 RepID=UPI003F8F2EA8